MMRFFHIRPTPEIIPIDVIGEKVFFIKKCGQDITFKSLKKSKFSVKYPDISLTKTKGLNL